MLLNISNILFDTVTFFFMLVIIVYIVMYSNQIHDAGCSWVSTLSNSQLLWLN